LLPSATNRLYFKTLTTTQVSSLSYFTALNENDACRVYVFYIATAPRKYPVPKRNSLVGTAGHITCLLAWRALKSANRILTAMPP
jgi:hypothetical protein